MRRPLALTRHEIEHYDLRRREVEVLHLIAVGCGTADIAATLHLSVNSVKTHTQAVFRKIDVTTRLQAAVWVWSRAGDEPLTTAPRRTSIDDDLLARRTGVGAP